MNVDATVSLADEQGSLREGERHKLLVEWNQTAREYPCNACVHELFEAQVGRSSEAIAVEFKGQSLTYRQLNARANQLAHHLRGIGIGSEKLVGICLEPSIDMVIALIGVLKAGGAYVPLDPAYPHERLRFMLHDSCAPVLLTHSKLRHIFPEAKHHSLYLDQDWPDAAIPNSENPGNLTTPENLAYLIYTSGSTGKPKGVAMVHRPLVNLIEWQLKDSRMGVGAKTLQFTSLSFDVSFQEMFATWCSGGTLVLILNETRVAPHRLWEFIVREKIARIYLPFVALRHLAEAAGLEQIVAENLREVITAGEQLQITPGLRELFARHPRATLHNHYGPSETHVVTALTLDGDPQLWPALPSVGRPIQNTQIYVLDPQLEPVPVGTPGELYIGGAALARGYFERPETTAEKFIPDPFAPEPGARLYRTGDLASFQPDAQIKFLGRMDHQVKISGYRVELGEIEAVLASHPQVQSAVVAVRESKSGDKCLAAYIVGRKPSPPSLPELRRFLKEKLPDYMVPAAVVKLASFPLTPNGKVDRQALPPPERDSMTLSEYIAPGIGLENKVAEIWKQVLELPQIGLHDSFFDLGGRSLLAVRLIAEINRVLNVNLDVLTLFEHPTIATLVAALPDLKSAPSGPKLVLLEAGGSGPPIFFFSMPMEVFWLAKMVRANQPAYLSESPFSPELLLASAQLNHAAFPSIAEMAAPHTAMIVASGLSGSCVLAGYSYGGILAFEVAHQLKTRGINVETVFLFDSNMVMPKWGRLKQHLWNSFRSGPNYLWGKIRERQTEKEEARLARRNAVQSPVTPSPTLAGASPEVWQSVHRIWLHALKHYRPRPLACRGILLRARQSIYEEIHDFDGCLGWRDLFAGSLEIIEVPGDHSSMWKEPQLRTLGKTWEASLKKLRQAKDFSVMVGFNLLSCGAANGF